MRSDRINFLAVVTAAAGLVGFVGVFADWFSLSYVASGVQVIFDFAGTEDGTGAIAVPAGLGAMAFGCAYILLQDPQIRRISSLLMVVSSVILLVVSTIGFTRVDEVFGRDPFLPGADDATIYVAGPAAGVGISFLAGIIATVASVLLVSRRESGQEVDTPPDAV